MTDNTKLQLYTDYCNKYFYDQTPQFLFREKLNDLEDCYGKFIKMVGGRLYINFILLGHHITDVYNNSLHNRDIWFYIKEILESDLLKSPKDFDLTDFVIYSNQVSPDYEHIAKINIRYDQKLNEFVIFPYKF